MMHYNFYEKELTLLSNRGYYLYILQIEFTINLHINCRSQDYLLGS